MPARKASRGRTTSTALLRPEMVRDRMHHPEWVHAFTDEGGQTQININVARLPAPNRALVADWAGAAVRGSTISLVFGQWPPGAPRMSGALAVQMATKRLDKILDANFRTKLDEYVETEGIRREIRSPDGNMYPAERYVTERATIMSAVFAEDDAELRFYWASRSDLQSMQQGQKANLIYPVVEVRLSVEELAHLVHTIAAVMPGETP